MGTIRVPEPLPSPIQDSEGLRKAFQGWGTDEKAIIQILGHRKAEQRLEISKTYRQLYNESLVQRLQSELSGDFGRAVILWALDPAERDAKLAKETLKKSGDKHLWPLLEITCASSPHHLMAVRQAYCYLFRSSLEEDISSSYFKEQPLRKLLVGLVKSYRYNGERVDEEVAKSEAAKLHDAIRKKQLYHEDLIRILCTRSKLQLKSTFKHYEHDYGIAIDEDLKSQSNNEKFASLLKVVVWCINTPEKHFAEVVRSSIVGFGTDEDSLTRAIVLRAEIDMTKIKEEYKEVNKASLDADVIGDTSGYYKDFLLTLLGSTNK